MRNRLERIFDLIESSFWGEDSGLEAAVSSASCITVWKLTLESYLLDMMARGMEMRSVSVDSRTVRRRCLLKSTDVVLEVLLRDIRTELSWLG